MNILVIRTPLYIGAALLMLALSLSLIVPPQVVVAANELCPNGTTATGRNGRCVCPDGYQQVTQAVDENDTHCIPVNANSGNINDNPIYFYLRAILRFMAAGVGLAVTGGIIFGGYMYITARANAGQVEKGKTIIINSFIGLLLFIFMFAILQFIIPGGIFT